MISYHVLQGNSYDVLSRLSNDSEQRGKYKLVVTSPPYYRHRHYGKDPNEIGQEETDKIFIDKLTNVFTKCRELLTEDGSLWIVLGDTRRKYGKLMIPHRLALKLVEKGYTFREDIVWYKKNNISSSSKDNFAQAYEVILFLSKNEKSFTSMSQIRVIGNEAREGRNKTPPHHMIQYERSLLNRDREKINKIKEIIRNAKHDTPFEELPTTSEIARAYGYDPEKYSGNVWEISTKAHYGNEHFAIFPEDLVDRIVKFATDEGDWVLDPFAGSGTTGIVCAHVKRNFTGIDLYSENIANANKNIESAIKGKFRIRMKQYHMLKHPRKETFLY